GEWPAGLAACVGAVAASHEYIRFNRCSILSSAPQAWGGCPPRRHLCVSGVSVKRANRPRQEAHPSTCRARASRCAVLEAAASRLVSSSSEGQEVMSTLQGDLTAAQRGGDYRPLSSLRISSWSIFCTLLLATYTMAARRRALAATSATGRPSSAI